jgi:co-chaperonin GroES (HSP10)
MIKPLLHRVLIKPDDLFEDPVFKRAREAGLAFGHSAELEAEKNRMDTGRVVAIGPTAFKAFMAEAGVTDVPLAVGDRISFAKYAGKTMMDDGERYIVLNDEDVVALLGESNG